MISTFLLLVVIGARNAKNNKRIFTVAKNIISEINGAYIDLFREKSLIRRSTQMILIIGAEIFIAIAIFISVIRHIDTYTIFAFDLIIKVLIQLIRNPHNIKSKHEEETSYSRIIIASILMVGLIVLNLFLAVCFINGAEVGAFTNTPNNFDLFYYTIITFTTIGYGDIVPISIGAKIISIVISVTSVICLIIF